MAADVGNGSVSCVRDTAELQPLQDCPLQLSFDICTITQGYVFVLGCLCGRELKSRDQIEVPDSSAAAAPGLGLTTVKTHGEMTLKSQTHLHVHEDIAKISCCGCSSCFYEPGKYSSSLEGL